MTVSSLNDEPSLPLPRILCLHGGGVSADIFHLQCRAIVSRLRPTFRLVFVDGPIEDDAHADIAAVFGEFGPFYRWLRWKSEHPAVDPPQEAAGQVVRVVARAMEADAGTGDWVGVLGFSQGAKVAASLLWAQERVAEMNKGKAAAAAGDVGVQPLTDFKFGVLMAGRGPIVRLDLRLPEHKYIDDAAAVPSDQQDAYPPKGLAEGSHLVTIPTVHVHGLEDTGLEHHRTLLARYFKPGTTRLVEWDGGHRLPIQKDDVEAVVSALLAAANDGGAFE